MTEETKSHLHFQSQSVVRTAPFQSSTTGLCYQCKLPWKEQTSLPAFVAFSFPNLNCVKKKKKKTKSKFIVNPSHITHFQWLYLVSANISILTSVNSNHTQLQSYSMSICQRSYTRDLVTVKEKMQSLMAVWNYCYDTMIVKGEVVNESSKDSGAAALSPMYTFTHVT